MYMRVCNIVKREPRARDLTSLLNIHDVNVPGPPPFQFGRFAREGPRSVRRGLQKTAGAKGFSREKKPPTVPTRTALNQWAFFSERASRLLRTNRSFLVTQSKHTYDRFTTVSPCYTMSRDVLQNNL